MRLKLGDKKQGENFDDGESLPSDLSDDEWVEIIKYQKEKFEEDKIREKEEFEKRKHALRDTLNR